MEWLGLANAMIRRTLISAGVASERATVAGAEVHYYRAQRRGDGVPLLLVHGLGSSANAFFRTLLPLSRRFSRVYALDLPGNGFSPLPAGGPLSAAAQVELLLEFQRRVIGERVFLLGNSLGGAMALNAAAAAPEALHALGLVSPAGARVSEARFRQLLTSFEVHSARDARRLAHQLFARPPLGLLLFADELRKMVNTEAVRALVRHVSPADLFEAPLLRALSMPTLLIWGQQEKLLPYEGLEFFREHLPPHAEVHEVKEFGHMPQMEHPRAFVQRVLKFASARGLINAT